METKNAVITSLKLTADDHGLLTAWLMLDYGRSGQEWLDELKARTGEVLKP